MVAAVMEEVRRQSYAAILDKEKEAQAKLSYGGTVAEGLAYLANCMIGSETKERVKTSLGLSTKDDYSE